MSEYVREQASPLIDDLQDLDFIMSYHIRLTQGQWCLVIYDHPFDRSEGP
jgi:hypothetical protein